MGNLFDISKYNNYILQDTFNKKEIRKTIEDNKETVEQVSRPQLLRLSPLERVKQFEKEKEDIKITQIEKP